MGIFLLTCIFFVAGAMMEFAVLLHMKRNVEIQLQNVVSLGIKKQSHKNSTRSLTNFKEEANGKRYLLNSAKSNGLLDSVNIKEQRKFLKWAHQIDYSALFIFNILFFLFNCGYWIFYLAF